ncbi:MAG: BMP family lipoprotein [Candidatus Kariarchaeaceae archaeon]|jgi:basic membrane protein A
MSKRYLINRKNAITTVLLISLSLSVCVTIGSEVSKISHREIYKPHQQYNASIGIVMPLLNWSEFGLSENPLLDVFTATRDELSPTYEINWDARYASDFVEIENEILNVSSYNYDLVIGVGFFMTTALEAASIQYPNAKFVLIDSVSDKPNIASIDFKNHESSFLVGALSAMVSKKKHLGFLGALNIPLINAYRSGFEQGARYINPDIKISSSYSPNPDNAWQDYDGGYNLADQMLDDGVDIFYAAADNTGLGFNDRVIEAANNGQLVYTNWVDSDWDGYAPGAILSSAVKRYDTAITLQVEAVILDQWTPGLHMIGINENGVDISSMEYTQDEANYVCNDGKTRSEVIDDIIEGVSVGTIVIDSELQDPVNYNTVPHLCDATVTSSDTSSTSSDSSSSLSDSDTTSGDTDLTSSDSDDSSVPHNSMNLFIAIVALLTINKIKSSKRKLI